MKSSSAFLFILMVGNIFAIGDEDYDALDLLCSAGKIHAAINKINYDESYKDDNADYFSNNINRLAKEERVKGSRSLFTSFCVMLGSSKNLESLTLKQNNLYQLLASEWKILLTELSRCPKFRSLDLSDNSFGTEIGGDNEFWFEGLGLLESLEELNLSENGFGASPKKTRALGLNVAKMKRLKSLNFSKNYIGRLIIKTQLEVVGNFCKLSSLRSIDFAENNLSEEVMQLLYSQGFEFYEESKIWIRHPLSFVFILKKWLI
jgi:hypothetical protein